MHRTNAKNNVNGLFQQGDPTAGQRATQLTADWFNSVQEELVNLILTAGLALDPEDDTQLLTALRTHFGGPGTEGVDGVLPLQGGKLLQWGQKRGTFNQGSVSVTFPVAFATAAWSIQLTALNLTSDGLFDLWPQNVARTTSGFTAFFQHAQNGSDSIDGLDYLAIGK